MLSVVLVESLHWDVQSSITDLPQQEKRKQMFTLALLVLPGQTLKMQNEIARVLLFPYTLLTQWILEWDHIISWRLSENASSLLTPSSFYYRPCLAWGDLWLSRCTDSLWSLHRYFSESNLWLDTADGEQSVRKRTQHRRKLSSTRPPLHLLSFVKFHSSSPSPQGPSFLQSTCQPAHGNVIY